VRQTGIPARFPRQRQQQAKSPLGAQAKCLCSVHPLTGFPNPLDLRVADRAARKLPPITQAT